MTQAKFSLEQSQIDFLEQHRAFGYEDKSSMVRAAVQRLREELELRILEESAELYRQLHEGDAEAKAWVEDAVSAWPQ